MAHDRNSASQRMNVRRSRDSLINGRGCLEAVEVVGLELREDEQGGHGHR
jgi:hypothetical protein